MKALSLLFLGIVLIGITVVFRHDDLSGPRDSSAGLSGQESAPQSQIQDDQAGSNVPSQAEVVARPAPSVSQDKLLVFPDGEVLKVNWRKHKQPIVSQYGVDNYEILREAALNGDAIASIMLYEMQRSCQSRYESDDALEATIDQLHQTHTIPIPGQEQSARFSDPESIDKMATVMRSRYSTCEKLLAYQGNLEEKWLERSANDGWPLAMIECCFKHKQPTVSQYGVDNYEILREAALNGDAIASIMLYEMQRSCQSRYESDDALEATIDQLHQTHTIPIPGQEQSARFSDPESIDKMATVMRSRYSTCEKLLAYQGNLEEKWLERSANDGWPLAMIELGQQQEDQESARNLYQAAWDAGSAQSLSLLSEIMKRSYDNGEDPNANVEAFAVLHTYTIIETTLLEDQGRIAGRHAARLKAKLEDEQKQLLPRERDDALEMSKQMIRSNPNCCFGL